MTAEPATGSATPEKILNELARLWRDVSSQNAQADSEGVLRACAMTLIAAVDADGHAESSSAAIAHLMREHPSRAIILRSGEKVRSLDAEVAAQCWMPSGGRQQVCCEQIDISTPIALLGDMPKLLLALIAPDLPVMLWVRCPGLAVNGDFEPLFQLATKIIIDSECFGGGKEGYEFVAGWVRRGVNIVDLAWTRLTPLRQAIAEVFDDEDYRRSIAAIRSIEIAGAPRGYAATRYLSSWIQNALPGATVRVEAGASPELHARGEGLLLDVALRPLVERSEDALLGEELGIPEADAIFRRCFE